jgi:hypothetical protein
MRTLLPLATLITGLALLAVETSPAEALRWPPDNNPTATVVRARSTRKVKLLKLTDEVKLRNEQRRKDVKTIANAFFYYKRDHELTVPESIPLKTAKELCRVSGSDCVGMVDLTDLLMPYLEEMPVDPASAKDGNGTGYFISKDWKGRVTISAPAADDGWIIKEVK